MAGAQARWITCHATMIHGILFQLFALQNEVKNKQLLRWRACNHECCIQRALFIVREKQHPKVTTLADSITCVAVQARIRCIHVESTVLNILPHLFWVPPHHRSQHRTEKERDWEALHAKRKAKMDQAVRLLNHNRTGSKWSGLLEKKGMTVRGIKNTLVIHFKKKKDILFQGRRQFFPGGARFMKRDKEKVGMEGTVKSACHGA